eukprot:8048440-Pyramimonas_sp.AAC.1
MQESWLAQLMLTALVGTAASARAGRKRGPASPGHAQTSSSRARSTQWQQSAFETELSACLLYTSDAADDTP